MHFEATSTRLDWQTIHQGVATPLLGQAVRIRGWLTAPGDTGLRLLLMEPPCCLGCPLGPPGTFIRVAAAPTLPSAGMVELEGRLGRLDDEWRLLEPRRTDPSFGRRRLLAAAPLLCLAAASPAPAQAPNPFAMPADMATVDIHSHAGGVSRVRSDRPFTPVASPMREGGLAVVCLAIVADGPTHAVSTDRRIHPFRDPAPGELYIYSQQAFARLHNLAQQQGMPLLADAAGLQAARASRPSIVVSSEGADFLEGELPRLDEAFTRWKLRHLQLTHYRVNELGDIQTERPVHGGLTDFGAAVIGRCNTLGIVVDVAHGTLELVRRAAAVTTRPLVLSHTSLTTRPQPFTRLITPEHARLVAGTGGMIGIWPVKAIFPDMAAMAAGIARMAAVVGPDHVGLGSDTMGLVGPATFDTYAELPALAQALASNGFSPEDTRKILGGNYARIFTETVKS